MANSGKHSLLFLMATGFFVWLVQGITGCASIMAPTGGPRDSIAPVLQKSVPENFSSDFKAKEINLYFDEYVDLDNVASRLIVNPPLNKFPQIDRKLGTIRIRIKDTLEENTTYSWRFDGIIRDVNEGNRLGDFSYVFSTGKFIDSASLTGRVIDAETGKIDSTLVVLLYNNLSDSAVAKEKARYVTTLDGKGFFHFSYLAPGAYNVFALKDEGQKKYTDSSILFGFYDSTIQVGINSPAVDLLVFQAKKPEPPAPEIPTEQPLAKKPRNDNVDEEGVVKWLMVQPGSGPGRLQDLFEPFNLKFNRKFQTLDNSLLGLYDTTFKPVGNYTVTADSNQMSLSINTKWKIDSWYALVLNKGFAVDSAGLSVQKTDTILFNTKSEKDYSNIQINFSGLDFSRNPILQWMEGPKVYKQVSLTGAMYAEKMFKPGEYEIRIIYDENKNGQWDTGDYWTRKQPEKTLSIDRKFSLRPNWDNEFDVDVNAVSEEKE